MSIFQDHIADAQLIGYPAQVFQFQGFALAWKVVKFTPTLGFEDALFGEPLK
jgi:hypothetical protein